MLAQRAELLTAPARPEFCSIFRASNLQGALQLLEELRLTPITYQPQHHPPDAKGQSESCSQASWEQLTCCWLYSNIWCLIVSSAVLPCNAVGTGLALCDPSHLPLPRTAALCQPRPGSLLPPQDFCIQCSRGLVNATTADWAATL